MAPTYEYLPGDEVELYVTLDESGGEKIAKVVSIPHNGQMKIKFSNGNELEILVSNIAKRLYR